MRQIKKLYTKESLAGVPFKRLLALALGMLICFAAQNFIKAPDRSEADSASPVEPTPVAIAVKPVRQSSESLEVETIIFTRFGFEPDHISRPQGEFLLNVENRSQAGDMELRLDKVGASLVHHQPVSKERLDWRDFFTLEPGEYTLTESSHPDWSCRITITQQ